MFFQCPLKPRQAGNQYCLQTAERKSFRTFYCSNNFLNCGN